MKHPTAFEIVVGYWKAFETPAAAQAWLVSWMGVEPSDLPRPRRFAGEHTARTVRGIGKRMSPNKVARVSSLPVDGIPEKRYGQML